MPGLIKIGHTKNSLDDRLSQLNSTGVPMPFEVGANFLVNNPQKCELEIHRLFKLRRISKEREFFKLSLYEAVTAAFNIIQHYINDSVGPSNSLKLVSPIFDPTSLEIAILKYLAGDQRKYGLLTWQIHDAFRETDELNIEYKLANLKEQGLVDERRKKEYNDNNWKVTSKGVKYLFDNEIFFEEAQS